MAKVESCTHSPTHSLTHALTHSLTHYFLSSFPYLTFPYLSLSYLSFPFLSFPFHSLPFLTFPFLSLPFLTFPYLSLPYLSLLYLLRLLSQSGLRTRTSPNKPNISPLKFIGLPLNTHVRAPTTSITFSCTFCPKFKYEHQPTSPTEVFEIFSKHLQRKRVDPNKSQKGHLAEIYSVFGVLSFKCTHAHVEGISAIGSPSLFYVRIVTALTKKVARFMPISF